MLTERQLEVVLSVVSEFIQSGENVGSRTISKRYLTGSSAATIRNEMADLEEMGYLLQPHTSSGRIPTTLAYRLYVDSVLQNRRPLKWMYRKDPINYKIDAEGLRLFCRMPLSYWAISLITWGCCSGNSTSGSCAPTALILFVWTQRIFFFDCSRGGEDGVEKVSTSISKQVASVSTKRF